MSERIVNNQASVLILADFADGSWHATSFAMNFLYKDNSPISILQTYQNPRWGHFMMRKLSHQLKKITKHELKVLKNKLLRSYKIKEHKVKTLSIEGELNAVLKYKTIVNGPHNIVLSTYSSFRDSCSRQNACLEKIIENTSNPLFILPKTFEEEDPKKVLFVGNPYKRPSKQLSNIVKEICEKTQSNLEILFVMKNGNQKIGEDIHSYYKDYLNGIDFTMNQIQNKTRCKGVNKYLNNGHRNLIIFENL